MINQPFKALDSSGHRNSAVYVEESSSAIFSAGVSQPSDFRGREFSSLAILCKASVSMIARSVPLGRY